MRYYSGLVFIAFIILPSIIQAQNNFSPAKEALKLFNSYKPAIEKKNNAIVDDPTMLIGDINGDKQEDCIIPPYNKFVRERKFAYKEGEIKIIL